MFFIEMVEKIQSAKQHGSDTAAFERKIDLMVYTLYGLTYDEARTVDPALGLSSAKYDALPGRTFGIVERRNETLLLPRSGCGTGTASNVQHDLKRVSFSGLTNIPAIPITHRKIVIV